MGGRQCTQAVDIYSFGVVLWEVVTGERPQRGSLREPRVPQECPQVRGGAAGGGGVPSPAAGERRVNGGASNSMLTHGTDYG